MINLVTVISWLLLSLRGYTSIHYRVTKGNRVTKAFNYKAYLIDYGILGVTLIDLGLYITYWINL